MTEAAEASGLAGFAAYGRPELDRPAPTRYLQVHDL